MPGARPLPWGVGDGYVQGVCMPKMVGIPEGRGCTRRGGYTRVGEGILEGRGKCTRGWEVYQRGRYTREQGVSIPDGRGTPEGVSLYTYPLTWDLGYPPQSLRY